MNHEHPTRHRGAALLVSVVTLAGCGTAHVGIGFKKASLDLTFTQAPSSVPQAALTGPVVVSAVPPVAIPPTAPAFTSPPHVPPTGTNPPPPVPNPCPAAPPGAVPDYRVSDLMSGPPQPGAYLRRGNGSVVITQNGTTKRLPFPPYVVWKVSDAKTTSPDPVTSARVAASGKPEVTGEFTVTKNILPGIYVESDHYRFDGTAIQVMSRTVTSLYGTATFAPSRPYTWVQLVDGSGNSEDRQTSAWTGTGADPQSNQSVVVNGQYGTAGGSDRRVRLDICGSIQEGWLVGLTELDTSGNSANPGVSMTSTTGTSSTDTNPDNTFVIAPQDGAAILTEHQHYVVSVPNPTTHTVDKVEWNYTTTAMSVTPIPQQYLHLVGQ